MYPATTLRKLGKLQYAAARLGSTPMARLIHSTARAGSPARAAITPSMCRHS